jgi:GNAT superfamily N-acetyltransferase
MLIERVDCTDEAACHEVMVAAELADDPDGPRMSLRVFRGWLAVGWIGNPTEAWLAREPDGTVSGCYLLDLPDKENARRAMLWMLVVRPDRRRRGIGRELLRHAAGRAAANGRDELAGGALRGTPGEAFARTLGSEPETVEARRVLDLGKLPPGRAGELRAQAAAFAAGYSLLCWDGLVPEDQLAGVADVLTALSDAPHGTAEDEEWDAERVRSRSNGILPVLGLQRHSIAARHDASGELAALTSVAIDPGVPGWGFQEATAVTRKHRGRRLGLLVKSAMLELLAEAEPQLERIVTGNAASNAHMIAVNEALGYEVFGPPADWWLLPVTKAQAA